MSTARFDLGQVVATPAALDACLVAEVAPSELLARTSQATGATSHQRTLVRTSTARRGSRLLSSYALPGGRRVWLITEADRSSTCLLLPSEY
jgi:hypothetical protein